MLAEDTLPDTPAGPSATRPATRRFAGIAFPHLPQMRQYLANRYLVGAAVAACLALAAAFLLTWPKAPPVPVPDVFPLEMTTTYSYFRSSTDFVDGRPTRSERQILHTVCDLRTASDEICKIHNWRIALGRVNGQPTRLRIQRGGSNLSAAKEMVVEFRDLQKGVTLEATASTATPGEIVHYSFQFRNVAKK